MSSNFLSDETRLQFQKNHQVFNTCWELQMKIQWFEDKLEQDIFKDHKHCADFKSYNEDMQRIYTNLLVKWNASEDKVKKLQEEVELLKTQLNSRNEFQCSTKLLSSSPYLVAQSN